MSKHLGKIIDLIKAAKQADLFDEDRDVNYPEDENIDETEAYEAEFAKNAAWDEIEDEWDFKEYIKNHGDISEQQYIEALSGKVTDFEDDSIKDFHKDYDNIYNTPTINDTILHNIDTQLASTRLGELKDKFNTNRDKENEEEEDYHVARDKRREANRQERDNDKLKDNANLIYGNLNLSSKAMNQVIEEGNENVLKNPNFEKNHLYRMSEKHPQYLGEYLDHEHFDDKMAEKLFSSKESLDSIDSGDLNRFIGKKMEGYGPRGNLISEDNSLDLNPRIISTILEHAPAKITQDSMNVLLDHAEPSFKKQWTDKVLGMTEGEYNFHEPKDYNTDADFQVDNWDNWTPANINPEHQRLKNLLSQSRHMDEEQIEHVKRHGGFEDKYSLYNNTNIDPKHGAEMFQKWHDGDDDHGYDSDQLIEKFKEDKKGEFTIDDLDEDVIDSIREEAEDGGRIREWAEEGYTFSDWVRQELTESDVSDWTPDSDDFHEALDEKIREDHEDDWTGDNEGSIQNVGNPEFDALNKLNDAFDDDHITLEELKSNTGIDDWSKLELKPDSDGEVHTDEILEALDKFGGPAQIDYDNHDEYSIHDHPDYNDRIDAIANGVKLSMVENNPYDHYESFYEDYENSGSYQEAYEEALNDHIKDEAEEHFDELWEGSHQNSRFIPDHLHTSIPNFNELSRQTKAKSLDGGQKKFLNGPIKDRGYEHSYGDDQHFYEMVQDHAEANGGKIDIGTMNKLYPAQKERWKKIFAGKGKITHEEATQKLDDLPKTNYEISYGKWGSDKMQNINRQDQVIVRLDHSDESLKPLMDDPALYDTFKNVQKVSKQSGHPTRNNTIAWARVDMTDPEHWMIDEVQSDFGKTVTRYLKENNSDEKAGHIDKISAHHKNWREALINTVLKEAKRHGAQKVSTHSPESKSSHTSSSKIHSVYKDSYKKVPRQMGFQSSKMEDLPLSDSGKTQFTLESDDGVEKRAGEHEAASDYHTKAVDYLTWAKKNKDDAKLGHIEDTSFDNIMHHHLGRIQGHKDKTTALKQSTNSFYDLTEDGDEDALSGIEHNNNDIHESLETGVGYEHNNDVFLKTTGPKIQPPKTLGGHTFNLTPKLLKKHMDYVLHLYEQLETLEKGELRNAAKGTIMALALAQGTHMMGDDAKQDAAKEFSQNNVPTHARTVSSVETESDPVKQGYNEAKREANDIIYRNDKKGFINKYSDGLSHHVYKQTIKNTPELNEKYNYINKLSNNTFKEVIEKNPNLREDVHGAHYDKLHQEFGGDHEKMLHAWTNGIKNTHTKFREPASTTVGEQPSQDVVDETVKKAPKTP